VDHLEHIAGDSACGWPKCRAYDERSTFLARRRREVRGQAIGVAISTDAGLLDLGRTGCEEEGRGEGEEEEGEEGAKHDQILEEDGRRPKNLLPSLMRTAA
jgi:hypothetical protein